MQAAEICRLPSSSTQKNGSNLRDERHEQTTVDLWILFFFGFDHRR
jgi:hypothetical protein